MSEAINEFIIHDSFRDDEQTQPHHEARSRASDFVHQADVIDGDFAPVPDLKAKKRKILIRSLSVVGIVGFVAVAVIQINPDFGRFNQSASEFPLVAAGGGTSSASTPPIQLPSAAPMPPMAPPVQQTAAQAAPVSSSDVAATVTPQSAVPAENASQTGIIPAAPQTVMTSNAAVAAQPVPNTIEKSATLPQAASPSQPGVVTPDQAIEAAKSQKPAAIGAVAVAGKLTTQAKTETPGTVIPAQPVASAVAAVPQKAIPIQAAPKQPVPVKQVAAKPATGTQKSEASSNDEGGVKPLVTMTGDEIGLRFFTADALSVSAKGQHKAATYRVGDALRNGERIQHLDPSSMTIVTDRRVIRIN